MAKTNTQKTKAPETDAPTRAGYEVKVRIDRVVDYTLLPSTRLRKAMFWMIRPCRLRSRNRVRS